MASNLKNLSDFKSETLSNSDEMVIGIVVAEWNEEITGKLLQGAYQTLSQNGVLEENILVKTVPGTFELTLGAKYFIEYASVDAVIALGCVIQGETRHFDFICQGITQGITSLNVNEGIPVIFGVLTTENLQQALDRAGGKHGNKGDEAAYTALKMANLHSEFLEEEEAFMDEFDEDFMTDLEDDNVIPMNPFFNLDDTDADNMIDPDSDYN